MIWLWLAGFGLCVALAVAYEWQPQGKFFSVTSTIFLMLMIREIPHIGCILAPVLGTYLCLMMFLIFVAEPKEAHEEY